MKNYFVCSYVHGCMCVLQNSFNIIIRKKYTKIYLQNVFFWFQFGQIR